MTQPVLETNLDGLTLQRRGKVRDVYDLGQHLLIVATDRISAFDYVLGSGIPDKGKVLTQLSAFWFERIAAEGLVPHHLISIDVADFPAEARKHADILRGRSMLVRKTDPLPVECVARGYLSGSGLKDYNKTGQVCGHALPPGLRDSDKLPEPIFTPATKSAQGHDENISFEQCAALVGRALAEKVRHVSIQLYREASAYAAEKGILIADTKFEFGLDPKGNLVLIDEALTADSSRFWPAASYQVGMSPPSFDKQYVRDYLETLDWDKTPPGPRLPPDVIARTAAKYREALERLTGSALA